MVDTETGELIEKTLTHEGVIVFSALKPLNNHATTAAANAHGRRQVAWRSSFQPCTSNLQTIGLCAGTFVNERFQ
jgi:hypothetical protein